jgi:hypothetical protein
MIEAYLDFCVFVRHQVGPHVTASRAIEAYITKGTDEPHLDTPEWVWDEYVEWFNGRADDEEPSLVQHMEGLESWADDLDGETLGRAQRIVRSLHPPLSNSVAQANQWLYDVAGGASIASAVAEFSVTAIAIYHELYVFDGWLGRRRAAWHRAQPGS